MVVVDSSVLIPLSKIGMLDLIKAIFEEVITTEYIYRKVVEEGKGMKGTWKIKESFEQWISIKNVDRKMAEKVAELEGVTTADASLLILADDTSSELLTNDRALIMIAKTRNIEYYWLTSLLLKSTKEGKLKVEEAKTILCDLVDVGMNLTPQVYSQILKKLDEF